MERKVTKLEHAHVQVEVKVDEATWKAAQKKAFDKLAANVQVQGFRKGKAPENLVKGKIDPVKVMDNAINALLPEIYRDIIVNDGVKPFAQPKVDVTKLSLTELEVKFTIVTAPEVKLGKYNGFEIGKEEVSVTDEEVTKAVEDVQKQNAVLVVKEGASALGDTVVIDFVGTIDGVAFDGGSAENHELELGSHQFIPGFEEQLVGAKADEDRDVNVTFPENYVENLKGKAATFKIKVHEVKEKSMPVLDEDFVSELNIENVKSVDEYKAFVRKNLEAKAAQDADNAYYQDIVKQIRDGSKIEIAQEIIDSEVDAMKENFSKQLAQQGLDMKKYLEITGVKEEDMTKQMASEAEVNIRSVLVLDEIAKIEKIEVTEADLEFEYAKIADQYKMEIDKVKEILGQNKDRMMQEIRARRIRDFLFANNK